MARFLFVVPPLLGHLNPTLSVGGELLNRCHEVAWVSSKPFADDTIPEKGKFFLIDNIEDKIQAITQKVDAQKTFAFDFMYENVWLPYNRIIMEGLSEIVDQYKPSVLINDNYMFAATLCAYQKNISYATSVTALAEYICKHTMPELWNLREKYLFGFQKEFGINEKKSIADSNQLTLIFSSQEFMGNHEMPKQFKFVGPAISKRADNIPFDWHKLEGSKTQKVFISIGSILKNNQQSFFAKVIEAFKDEPLTIVAVAEPALFEKWPDNFIVQTYVPQIELLKYMDAVISHGGLNTISETLANGLPMVVVPMVNDQFLNANLVESIGCGICLQIKRLPPRKLREALWSILSNEQYRLSATKIMNSFIRAGGSNKAASYLEELAASDVQTTLS